MELIVVSGKPNSGKTATICGYVDEYRKDNKRVAIFLSGAKTMEGAVCGVNLKELSGEDLIMFIETIDTDVLVLSHLAHVQVGHLVNNLVGIANDQIKTLIVETDLGDEVMDCDLFANSLELGVFKLSTE